MKELSLPSEMNRAQWQRGEAMILFDGVVRELYGRAAGSLNEEELRKAACSISSWGEATEISLIAGAALKRQAVVWLDYVDYESIEPFVDSIGWYTYYGEAELTPPNMPDETQREACLRKALYGILNEGLTTMTTFPINLMNDLRYRHPQYFQSLQASPLEGFADVLGKPWFKRMCNQVAHTGNGYWGMGSTLARQKLVWYGISANANVVLEPYLQTDEGFRLSETALTSLRAYLKTPTGRPGKTANRPTRWNPAVVARCGIHCRASGIPKTIDWPPSVICCERPSKRC